MYHFIKWSLLFKDVMDKLQQCLFQRKQLLKQLSGVSLENINPEK